ncbi:hypothetical protein [Salisediminibacterium beveridgei]|uniref:Uncharacterized protein n=1 Tax=Salisediminibacterium beveridgei TaxID=632773 RepID=A0A1D7QU36_9BACI|nr:hypothetical protein [Salisediminibacterium beveridgei]AOM82534.1 hypothetical protein BBEV_1166 [Salisediminibacterium beveridgei]
MTKDQLKGLGTGIILATALFIPSVLAGDEEPTDAKDQAVSDDAESVASDHGDQFTDEKWEEYQELIAEHSVVEEMLLAADEKNQSLNEEIADLETELEERKDQEAEKVDASAQVLYLVVTQGMTAGEIGEILERAEVVNSSSEFRQYIEDEELVMSIRTGEYLLTEDMAISEIADQITK